MHNEQITTLRADQIAQGDLWKELEVRHLWFHVVRGMVTEGEIAKIGAIPFCVYLVIKAHSDLRTGSSRPSITTIARLLDVSADTVERAQKKLVAQGYLTVMKQGRKNIYQAIEKIQITDNNGEHWGTGERPYASLKYAGFVEDLQRLARNGNIPGDQNITINVTVNVQNNITQGDGGTVITNQQNVTVKSDAELQKLLRNL